MPPPKTRIGNSRRHISTGMVPCQICGTDRFEDEADTNYCQDCRDICLRLAKLHHQGSFRPEQLPPDVYAERQALYLKAMQAAEAHEAAHPSDRRRKDKEVKDGV